MPPRLPITFFPLTTRQISTISKTFHSVLSNHILPPFLELVNPEYANNTFFIFHLHQTKGLLRVLAFSLPEPFLFAAASLRFDSPFSGDSAARSPARWNAPEGIWLFFHILNFLLSFFFFFASVETDKSFLFFSDFFVWWEQYDCCVFVA